MARPPPFEPAELPLTVQLVSVVVPKKLDTAPPPSLAEFPLTVQLVSVDRGRRRRCPGRRRPQAELPLTVQLAQRGPCCNVTVDARPPPTPWRSCR